MRSAFALLLVALVMLSLPAHATQGYFGGRPEQDGSINIRRSTTEQFDPIRGQSVAERPRPDFAPTPLGLGSFQLFPALNAGAYYDSNIYARPNAPASDLVWKLNPSLSAVSNWGRHALAFTGMADVARYTDNDEENYLGGFAQMEGRYDFMPQYWAAISTSYQRTTEPRSSASVLGAADEPTQYDNFLGHAELYRGIGTLKAKASYDFGYRDYDAVSLMGGGTASLNARNRFSNGLSGEVQYDVSQNFRPFMRGGFDWRDYTVNAPRSSHGYNVDLGARFDFGGVTTAEAYIGYRGRDYYNFASPSVDLFDFGGKMLWNVTELTSVEVEAARTIEETTVAGASSFAATGGSLTITHELLRNVVVEGNASYTNNDYQGVVRGDDNYGFGAGTRYYFSRNLYGDFTYDFTKRTSNAAGADYDRHVAYLRFGVQY